MTRIRRLAVAAAMVLAAGALQAASATLAGASCSLSVSGISPDIGFVAGGQSTTISGCGFTGAGTVTVAFGAGAPVTVVPSSDSSLAVTTPAVGSPGAVTVTVATSSPAASATTSFTYVSPPAISSIVPTSGPSGGGNSVLITGTDLSPPESTTAASFGATGATVSHVTNTSLVATAPSGAGTVAVTVTVTLPGSDSATSTGVHNYVYVPAPTVTSVSPTSGPVSGGTDVTVTGTDFLPGARVFFGPSDGSSNLSADLPAIPTEWLSATSLLVTSPPGVVGATNVVVVNPDSQYGVLASGAAGHFSYTGTAPSVSSVVLSSGTSLGGVSVTVNGAGFLANADVEFVDATMVGASSNGVAVSTFSGGGTLNVASTAGFPVSGSVSVATSTGVAVVSYTALTATAFTGAATISGGGTLATGGAVSASTAAQNVVVNSDTKITATTPAHPAGAVAVQVRNVGGGVTTLASAYTFTAAPAPTVSSVVAASGSSLGGTPVTVTGTNFASGAAVFFGGARSPSAAVINPTTMSVAAPAHAAGVVAITVQLSDGQSASLGAAFTYSAAPAPTITSVTPNTGPGGTQITITGTGFANSQVVTAHAAADALVSVGSAPCDPTATSGDSTCLTPVSGATPPTIVQSDTQIVGLVPNAPGGVATVTVTNPDGQSATSSFTYTGPAGPPTLTSIAPAAAGTLGGTPVTLTGTQFVKGATIAFVQGGVAVKGSAVVVNGAGTSISAMTPAGVYGTVDIRVTNPGGLSVTLINAFDFTTAAQPSITSVTPVSGPNCTLVTITGTGFANVNGGSTNAASAASVTVGGQALQSSTACGTTVTSASSGVDVSTFAGSGVLNVASTVSFPTSGSLHVATSAGTATITYTGVTATTFAGATTTVGAGTLATGAVVSANTTSPVVVSDTTIVGIVPNLPSGSYDVAVMNPDGQGDILVNGYNYPADVTIPTIAATGNSGAYTFGTWSRGSVSVALAASDSGGSGVASITYSATGAQSIALTTLNAANATFAITAQGTTTVTFYATTFAGHSSTPQSATVEIDSVSPSLGVAAVTSPSLVTYVSGTSTNQSVVVTFTCSDATSGVSTLGYTTTAGSSSSSGTNPLAVTIPNSSPGLNMSVTGTCTDAAGNSTSTTFSNINIVTTVPTIHATTTAGGAAYTTGTWTNQTVTVSFSCTPISISDPIVSLSSPVQINGPVTNGSASGTCTDAAGNTSNIVVTGIDIDHTLPIVTASATTTNNSNVTVPYTAGAWTNHNVVVTFTCTDTGPNQSGMATVTAPVTVSLEGTTSAVAGNCKDVAGNAAVTAFFGPILIDKTAPSCTVSISPNPIGPANGKLVSVTALVKVIDALSGPNGFTLISIASNSPSTYANDVKGFTIGTASVSGQLRATKGRSYTFSYRGYDVAGNPSALCTVTVTVR